MVTGTVILVIGVSLMNIGVNWAAGGQPSAPDYGSPLYLGVALFTLVVILALTRFTRGLVNNIAVLLGVIVGCVLAAPLGKMNFAPVAAAPVVGLVLPFQFGPPRFELVPIATMCLVMIVVMVESLGMFFAVGEMVGRPHGPEDASRAACAATRSAPSSAGCSTPSPTPPSRRTSAWSG